MSKQEKHFYEFGPFRLDPVKRRLLHNGEPLPLAPKAFDTLLALVQQSGKTIEKDDLMKRVWPDAVVEENNLNQNITALRKSLGDSRQESKYIATIPGFGYRFVAEVKLAPLAEPERDLQPERDPQPDPDAPLPAVAEKPLEAKRGDQIDAPEQAATRPQASASVASHPQKGEPAAGARSPVPEHAASGEPILASLRRHRKVAGLAVALII